MMVILFAWISGFITALTVIFGAALVVGDEL